MKRFIQTKVLIITDDPLAYSELTAILAKIEAYLIQGYWQH